ncbi:hypothetical protein KC365_g22 [Hortaea werneckii]|nr:hypothetical protein KC365_g22 [Hortaea werneckii]
MRRYGSHREAVTRQSRGFYDAIERSHLICLVVHKCILQEHAAPLQEGHRSPRKVRSLDGSAAMTAIVLFPTLKFVRIPKSESSTLNLERADCIRQHRPG